MAFSAIYNIISKQRRDGKNIVASSFELNTMLFIVSILNFLVLFHFLFIRLSNEVKTSSYFRENTTNFKTVCLQFFLVFFLFFSFISCQRMMEWLTNNGWLQRVVWHSFELCVWKIDLRRFFFFKYYWANEELSDCNLRK